MGRLHGLQIHVAFILHTKKYGVSVLRLGIPEIIDLCGHTTHTTGEHKMHFRRDTRKCLPNQPKGFALPSLANTNYAEFYHQSNRETHPSVGTVFCFFSSYIKFIC